LKQLLVATIPYGNKISFPNQVWLFRADPMGDEAPMFPGFFIIRAFVPEHVVSGELAS
jgi:hypothetical protein